MGPTQQRLLRTSIKQLLLAWKHQKLAVNDACYKAWATQSRIAVFFNPPQHYWFYILTDMHLQLITISWNVIFNLQKLLNIPLRKSHLLIHFGSRVPPCLCPVTSTRSSTPSTWANRSLVRPSIGEGFVLWYTLLCGWGKIHLHVPLCSGSQDIFFQRLECCCKRSVDVQFPKIVTLMSNNQNHHLVWRLFYGVTLPETNSSHLPGSHPRKETIVFQPSIFRCRRLISGKAIIKIYPKSKIWDVNKAIYRGRDDDGQENGWAGRITKNV